MQIGLFAFIKNNEGEVLLVQDATREEKWTMPGGGLDFQEIVTEGIKREIKEEIGVKTEVKNIVGIFSQQKTPGVVLLFECKLETLDFILDKKEVQSAKYFSELDLEKIKDKIKPAQYSMIKQVLESSEFPIFSDFSS